MSPDPFVRLPRLAREAIIDTTSHVAFAPRPRSHSLPAPPFFFLFLFFRSSFSLFRVFHLNTRHDLTARRTGADLASIPMIAAAGDCGHTHRGCSLSSSSTASLKPPHPRTCERKGLHQRELPTGTPHARYPVSRREVGARHAACREPQTRASSFEARGP